VRVVNPKAGSSSMTGAREPTLPRALNEPVDGLPHHAYFELQKQKTTPDTMKNPAFFPVIGLLLFTALLLSGCASMQSGGQTTLKQTQIYVDWPMTRYRNAVARGVVTLGEQQQVNAAYASYQSAFAAAVQAAHSNYDAPTPDNVKQLADQVVSIVSAIPY